MSGPSPWATTRFGLRLHDGAGNGSHRLSELVLPGLRRNPRRAHLLVSTVLGKHIAIPPSEVRDAGDQLGEVVDTLDVGEADALGMAETATGLGHCVADRLGAAVYLHSTRRPAPADHIYAEFQEGHSHATDHLLQPAGPDLFTSSRPLVLVDDEISTGDTALATIEALHRRCPRTRYVVASLVDVRDDSAREAAIRTAQALGTSIDFVSLATGRVDIPEQLIDDVCALPSPPLNSTGDGIPGSYRSVPVPWPEHVPDGGRHGFLRSDADPFAAAVAEATTTLVAVLDSDRPVLVVGHEELMYLPLRIAERLAAGGWTTRFQSTTRSPAYVVDDPGYPLRTGFEFPASEPGATGPRYLYNGWPDRLDGVRPQLVLVMDTAAAHGAAGLTGVLTAAGYDVVLGAVGGPGFTTLAAARDRS